MVSDLPEVKDPVMAVVLERLQTMKDESEKFRQETKAASEAFRLEIKAEIAKLHEGQTAQNLAFATLKGGPMFLFKVITSVGTLIAIAVGVMKFFGH